MFINNFDPVAFQIMSFEIRWYSLAYIFGIIIGWLLCKKIFIKDTKINEKFDDALEELRSIIMAEKLNIKYQKNNYQNLVDQLTK